MRNSTESLLAALKRDLANEVPVPAHLRAEFREQFVAGPAFGRKGCYPEKHHSSPVLHLEAFGTNSEGGAKDIASRKNLEIQYIAHAEHQPGQVYRMCINHLMGCAADGSFLALGYYHFEESRLLPSHFAYRTHFVGPQEYPEQVDEYRQDIREVRQRAIDILRAAGKARVREQLMLHAKTQGWSINDEEAYRRVDSILDQPDMDHIFT